MREIKFRAWDGSINEMILPEQMLKGDGLYLAVSGKQKDFYPMQYTGLKDKNGKEIYEGDILSNNKYPDVGEVVWSNDVVHPEEEPTKGIFGEYVDLSGYFSTLGEFKIKSKNGKAYHIQDTEIIGNIYENPNLIN